MAALSSLSFLPIVLIISFSYLGDSQNDSYYYNLCAPLNCGNISFTFPFSRSEQFGTSARDCGLPQYDIVCEPSSSVPKLKLSGNLYQVKALFPSERLITVFDNQLIDDLGVEKCDSLKNLTSSPTDTFKFPLLNINLKLSINLTFFKCPNGLTLSEVFLRQVVNYSCKENYRLFLPSTEASRLSPVGVEAPYGCTSVIFPVFSASLVKYDLLNSSKVDLQNLLDLLTDGFPLQWPVLEDCDNCERNGGRCGYDGSSGIVCFCEDGCDDRHSKYTKFKRWKLIVGVTVASTFLALALALLLIFKFKRKALTNVKISKFKKKISLESGQNVNQFIKNYRSTLVTEYSYADIKKMTNGFKEKLGEGGYGNVFKGKLLDGRFVAAKMLEKSRDNGQDFINEVATVGMIHHVNIIRLLGYCCEGSKRALIYEFMPNGSLGDLVCKEKVSHSLGWPMLLEIAIGIAHGIEYLHHGCDSRILHLDIKPHNILLDHNFHPKISDFGLAKSYSRNHSVVPLTGAKGTIGYIAPEIFMRNLGGVSHKSDVYSYGMLLLEMIGGTKNFVESKKQISSSKTYFPSWIYDQLIQEKDMELIDSIVGEEVYIARKMVMVGLWCIQINPNGRPSMTKVVEMLSGSVEAIEMPPKPFFFSPPRVQFENESSSINADISDIPLTSGTASNVTDTNPFIFSPPRVQFEKEISSINSDISEIPLPSRSASDVTDLYNHEL